MARTAADRPLSAAPLPLSGRMARQAGAGPVGPDGSGPADLCPAVGAERPDAALFLQRVRAFRLFGTLTQAFSEAGIPYLVNEFWTAGQRPAHSLHEICYRACFKPQLPASSSSG